MERRKQKIQLELELEGPELDEVSTEDEEKFKVSRSEYIRKWIKDVEENKNVPSDRLIRKSTLNYNKKIETLNYGKANYFVLPRTCIYVFFCFNV